MAKNDKHKKLLKELAKLEKKIQKLVTNDSKSTPFTPKPEDKHYWKVGGTD